MGGGAVRLWVLARHIGLAVLADMKLTKIPRRRKSLVRLEALLPRQRIQTSGPLQLKKTLFSLAFVAASGIYVAAANHLFGAPDEGTTAAVALPAPAVGTKPSIQPSRLVVSPAAIATPSNQGETSSPPAPAESVSAPSLVRPVNPLPAAAIVAGAAPVRVPGPVSIPLPRPRPAPPASVVQTQVAANQSPGLRNGTYTGASENAYYGRVQVQVTIAGEKIAGIKVLDYPQDRRTSRYINSQALPLLQQEVMAADSANVDVISGATLTSEAYIRSLSSALQQAGAANA